jgi:hypothetical protein
MELAIETLVERPVSEVTNAERFESQRVLELATRPLSVAEVSAHLGLPLGTTLVLVSDLLESGQLSAHETTDQSEVSNLDIMTRIIHCVREL